MNAFQLLTLLAIYRGEPLPDPTRILESDATEYLGRLYLIVYNGPKPEMTPKGTHHVEHLLDGQDLTPLQFEALLLSTRDGGFKLRNNHEDMAAAETLQRRELIDEAYCIALLGEQLLDQIGDKPVEAQPAPDKVPMDSVAYLLHLMSGGSSDADLLQVESRIKLLLERNLITLGVPADPNSTLLPNYTPTDAGVKLTETVLLNAGRLRNYAQILMLIELGNMRALKTSTSIRKMETATYLTQEGYAYSPGGDSNLVQITSDGLDLLTELFHQTAPKPVEIPVPSIAPKAETVVILNANELIFLLSLNMTGARLSEVGLDTPYKNAASQLHRRDLLTLCGAQWALSERGMAHANYLCEHTGYKSGELLTILQAHVNNYRPTTAEQQSRVEHLVNTGMLVVVTDGDGYYGTTEKGNELVYSIKAQKLIPTTAPSPPYVAVDGQPPYPAAAPARQPQIDGQPPYSVPAPPPPQKEREPAPCPAPPPLPHMLLQSEVQLLLEASIKGEIQAEDYQVQPLIDGGFLVSASPVRTRAYKLTNAGQIMIAKIMHTAASNVHRPPLGLRPNYIFEADLRNKREEQAEEISEMIQERIEEVRGAIKRYSDTGQPVPIEWTAELEQLIKE